MGKPWRFPASIGLLLLGLAGSAFGADEIVIAGRRHHAGTTVILWTDPGGYNAYTGPTSSPRFGSRSKRLSVDDAKQFDRGGWNLDLLSAVIDQFVIHYDAAGTSRRCFQTLNVERNLSVHFLLDLDGTIYQTLDLQEAAWHATIANPRSIGIEIANLGAFPVDKADPFANWYITDPHGQTRINIPGGPAKEAIHNRSIELRPSLDQPIVGLIQGQTLRQYDLTPPQYQALIALSAKLCTLFPRISPDVPRDDSGRLITTRLGADVYRSYHGLLGHYHVQADKVDPGPAFRWEDLIEGTRNRMAQFSKASPRP